MTERCAVAAALAKAVLNWAEDDKTLLWPEKAIAYDQRCERAGGTYIEAQDEKPWRLSPT